MTHPRRASLPTYAASGGAALVAVLAVVALVAVTASSLAAHQDFAVQSLRGRQEQTQSRWLARAALDWARQILAEDAAATSEDHGGESWATRTPPLPVVDAAGAAGEVVGGIDDMSGRFNLNNLAPRGRENVAQRQAFAHLLDLLGIAGSEGLAAALTDWLDTDEQPRAAESAESAYYGGLAHPYRAANAPLDDVDDLLRIRGFTPPIVERLRPLVAALPIPRDLDATAINVNTASPEVLAAVIAGLSLDAATRLSGERARNWFVARGGDRLADFRARLPSGAHPVEGIPLDVRSQYFLISGRVRVGDALTGLRALVYRSDALGAPWPSVLWQRLL